MVQRYERRTIQEELTIARNELEGDYELIQELNYQQLTTVDSAELLISMIGKLSSPIIGTQILKTDLFQLQFPFFAEYQAILEKAEIYYYQSIIADLSRIKDNENFIQISRQQISKCVEELNWRAIVEKSSRVNESQQIGENMDLMKFFQGVRNYQNWHENIKRETFTRLKERSHAIENELSFKKGFILSKMERQLTDIQTRNYSELFLINHQYVRFERIIKILSKIRQNKIKQVFNIILAKSKQTSIFKTLQDMFVKDLPRRYIGDIRKTAIQFKVKKERVIRLINKLSYFKKKIEIVLKHTALKKLTITPMIKASKYTNAMRLISHACQKYCTRIIMKAFNLPTKTIFYRLNEKYLSQIRQVFNQIKQNDLQIRLERPNVSYRVKGKILVSLNKYQKEPINLKQTFSKWYLNTHEQKYAKKVYNIWLQGNTNKFTFFMRLKNLADQMSKHKISKELRNLVKVICDRFHKYQEHNKKHMLTKWIENNRRLRKIENMFKLLTSITNETIQGFKKLCIQKIADNCKRKHIIKQYCNKYMFQHIENAKIALSKWKTINNLKKEEARKKIRKFFLDLTEEMINTKKETISIFKEYWAKGQNKKITITRNAINKDSVFLQRFMQIWRHNIRTSKAETNIAEKQAKANKLSSITGISSAFKRVQMYQLREVIKKFNDRRLQKIRRQANLRKNFINMIESNERQLKKEVLDVFAKNLSIGQQKKQRSVSKIVCVNVSKFKMGFSIFRNKAFEMTQLLKREKSAKLFDILESKVKENYLIFNRRLFIGRVLQKIINSKAQKISSALKIWKAMPLRIRWKLRSKFIALHQKLSNLKIQRLSFCNDAFKSSLITGKLKQKKVMYIMACKYEMILKKYFGIYQRNTGIQKEDDKIVHVARLFEAMHQGSKNNMKPLYESPPEWPKKAAHFVKLNQHVRKRAKDYLQYWLKIAKAISDFDRYEKKKKSQRLLRFSEVMNNIQNRRLKEIVSSFKNNRFLMKQKMHILKKMCDSQVIKVLKGFNSWKNLPGVTKKEKIQKAASFESKLTRLVNRNIKLPINVMKMCLKTGREKKLQLVRTLVSHYSSQIHFHYNKWRQNKNIKTIFNKQNKIQRLFNILNNESRPFFELLMIGDEAQKKTKGLKIIENYWIKQRKQYIKQWHRNTINFKLKDLSKKFFLTNLINIKQKHSNKILAAQIIDKFKINKDEKIKQKHKNRSIQLAKVIDRYENQKRLMVNFTIDKLKFNHIKGNFYKNRSFHRFLREKITQVHKMLDIWNKLAQQTKATHQQKMAAHNFDHMQEILRKNFLALFGRTKESTIKKNILQRLFKATEFKYKGYFDLWRQTTKEIRIYNQFDKKSRAAILQRINKIVEATSTHSVINAIKKFNLNLKVQRVQRKFMERLLQTKSGKVINAFNNWKAIPVANMMGKYKNYQKFYFKLENFFKDRLKFAHSVFSSVSEDANLMKKQSILKLFQMTSLGIRRYYNRWTRLTKEKHILMTVNRALRAFQSGESAIANQYQIIFQDERAYRLKIATIDKLILATRGTTQNYFTKWRQNARQIKFANSMDKEKKKLALSIFDKVMGNSKTGQVLRIVEMFQKNAKIVKVSKNFFNRLMNTKAGKVHGFFQKLKTIPDAKMNKLKKKGIIFQSRLHNFVHKRLRVALNPFKQNTFSANTKKKYCIERLLRACMGQNQKKFLIWRNVNRQGKMLVHTSLFQKIFNNIQSNFKRNFGIAIKDAAPQVQKKKNLCRKLINNSLFVQHHAYMIWKEAYHVDDINTKTRQNHYTMHLKNLISVFKSNQNKKSIQVIGEFRKMLEMRSFEQQINYKNYKNKKCLKFYGNLKKIESNFKNIFVNALKTNQAEYILAEKTKRLDSVFQAMQTTAKQNMNYLIRTQNQTALLNKTFSKLTNNTMMNVSRLFNIWRENKKALNYKADIQKEKKKQALKLLNNFAVERGNNKIVQILHKFSQNAKVVSIKRRLFVKILKAKSDKVPTSFNNWKNLPYQEAKKLKNKATKFENSLLNLMKNHLKEVNDCFRRCHFEAITKKEEATRRLVRSKLMDINNMFFRWRKINNQNKITEKIISLDKTFTNMQNTFHDNFSIFEDSKIQDQRKVRGISNLFFNNVKRLQGFFNIWRKNARITKLHQFEKLMRNFNPEDFNKRLVRIGFIMIAKRHEIQALKGYINSLWKWKLSNIQASYYTKFISIFKESQQMIKLSNLINKKLYQNTHHSFRNILSMGNARTNRKKEIVEKYLTRKARNYFLIFKNNTFQSQINIWKSKYTESIKSKILTDVLGSIFRKPRFFAFQALRNFNNYASNIYSLKSIFDMYQKANLKASFNKIRYDGQLSLFNKSFNLYGGIRHSNMSEAFTILKNIRKVSKFNDILTTIINKNLKKDGISHIHKRKERIIKSKLSIILLETLLKQRTTDSLKLAINQFNKNRVKRLAAEKLFKFMALRYENYGKTLLEGCKSIQNIAKLLQRFRRGQMLQKILEKQDEQLKKIYLNKMRKKQNKWMELAIKKFATRALIRSSPEAITLWRFKTYAFNT